MDSTRAALCHRFCSEFLWTEFLGVAKQWNAFTCVRRRRTEIDKQIGALAAVMKTHGLLFEYIKFEYNPYHENVHREKLMSRECSPFARSFMFLILASQFFPKKKFNYLNFETVRYSVQTASLMENL